MKNWLSLFLLVLFFFCWSIPAFAAQSTADVVVDSAMKKQLREAIVGDLVLPGEQLEYVIGHGDVIAVSIFGEGDMAASAAEAAVRLPGIGLGTGVSGDSLRPAASGIRVRLDGRVSLKHVGEVHVAGMTMTQAADYFKKLYLTVFADPIITVTLVQSNSRRYTVMGKVNSPGIFHLDLPVTVVKDIARAGGFSEWANHDVTVIRQGNDISTVQQEQVNEQKTLVFDYDDFLKGKNLGFNIHVLAGDVLIVH